MKRLLFLMCWFIPGISCAQEIGEDEVPESVMNSFMQKFPAAETYTWSLNEDKLYSVEFYNQDLDYEAGFTLDGEWVYSRYPIEEDDIPGTVKKTISLVFTSPMIMESYHQIEEKGKELYLLVVQEEVAGDELEAKGSELDRLHLYEIKINKKGEVVTKNSL